MRVREDWISNSPGDNRWITSCTWNTSIVLWRCNCCTGLHRKEDYLWSIQSGFFIPLDTGKYFFLVWNNTTGEGFWPTGLIPEENKRVIRKLGNKTVRRHWINRGFLIWGRENWGNMSFKYRRKTRRKQCFSHGLFKTIQAKYQ